MRRLFLPLLLASLLAWAPAALAKPAMWIVRDADSTILMFGSVHALPKGLDWTPAELSRALAQADDLWFEIPNDEAAALASSQAAAGRGILPAGQSLSAMLDKATQARLAKAAGSLGLSMAVLDHYRPWMAEVMLSLAYIQKSGADVDEGVEAKVAAAAPAKTPRRAFETPQQQIAFLADAAPSAQIASLKETLREIEAEPKSYDDMVRAWMRGDVRALYKESVEPMKRAAPGLYRRLVADRNQAWAVTIEERLKGSGRTVMVMGAGHFAGPDGVPALLRKRGLAVEGP